MVAAGPCHGGYGKPIVEWRPVEGGGSGIDEAGSGDEGDEPSGDEDLSVEEQRGRVVLVRAGCRR